MYPPQKPSTRGALPKKATLPAEPNHQYADACYRRLSAVKPAGVAAVGATGGGLAWQCHIERGWARLAVGAIARCWAKAGGATARRVWLHLPNAPRSDGGMLRLAGRRAVNGLFHEATGATEAGPAALWFSGGASAEGLTGPIVGRAPWGALILEVRPDRSFIPLSPLRHRPRARGFGLRGAPCGGR